MTVRDKAGRRRFILFDIQGNTEVGMGGVITVFNNRFRDLGIGSREIRFRVIFVGEGVGIVRCSHLAKDDIIALINSTKLDGRELATVRTSGTLKTVKDWLRNNRGITLPARTRTRNAERGRGSTTKANFDPEGAKGTRRTRERNIK